MHNAKQRGGTVFGLILGLVLGLGVALVVAVYVTKAPVPFIDRGVLGSDDKTARSQQPSANWNPNAGFNQNQATSAESAPAPTESQNAGNDAQASAAPADTPAAAPPAAEARPGKSADPLGELALAKAAPATLPAPVSTRDTGQVQELVFFVQAGAFGQLADAESQRAKLALLGVDARVSQDSASERSVYRVRSGPFRTRSQAQNTRAQLSAQNIETVIVAVAK